jgi:hypothetical protein
MTNTIGLTLTAVGAMFLAVIGGTSPNAQEVSGYLVQPTTKVYSKFRNPLLKSPVKPVTVLVLNGRVYLDGDILLGSVADLDAYQKLVPPLSVTNDPNPIANARWVNGIVPFTIAPGFNDSDRQAIISSLNYIASRTNVCFRSRNNESNYIKFKAVTEAQLGYQGGHSELGRCAFCPDGQEIQMTHVTNRTVRHEVGHALGLLHEQSRRDRDTFIEIIYENIQFPMGLGSNFGQAVFTSSDVGDYDFASIMHYRSTAFGKMVGGVRQQTIRRKCKPKDQSCNPKDQSFGKSSTLSPGDIAGINAMYPSERSCAALK